MRYDDFPYEPDAVRAMRINLMPLSAKTFKLNEDLYMNDTLREEGHAASAIPGFNPSSFVVSSSEVCSAR